MITANCFKRVHYSTSEKVLVEIRLCYKTLNFQSLVANYSQQDETKIPCSIAFAYPISDSVEAKGRCAHQDCQEIRFIGSEHLGVVLMAVSIDCYLGCHCSISDVSFERSG